MRRRADMKNILIIEDDADIAAIERVGLSPIHRKSFCTAFTQQTLF